ncbi:MAG TPA: riboflavin synthase [Vicinamibacteria bacterium]
MFTGIVEERGTVRGARRRGSVLRVEISAARVLEGLAVGGSIAVSGCCLSAVEVGGDAFACELTEETLARTAFGARLVPGAVVNLERPLRADGRLDGHIVQGHVDGVGRVAALAPAGETAVLDVDVPEGLRRYLVEKGSVAVEGVSLTVAALREGGFAAALIPLTLSATNLAGLRPGDAVNLEMDVLAKYVERLLQHG